MTSATYTIRGKTVTVEIVTSRANLADHNCQQAVYELVVSVDGVTMVGNYERVDHAEYGPVLRPYFGRALIPVAVDAVEAVDAVFAEYRTESSRRRRDADAADAAYEAHRAGVERMMRE